MSIGGLQGHIKTWTFDSLGFGKTHNSWRFVRSNFFQVQILNKICGLPLVAEPVENRGGTPFLTLSVECSVRRHAPFRRVAVF